MEEVDLPIEINGLNTPTNRPVSLDRAPRTLKTLTVGLQQAAPMADWRGS
jgi:hypothetical protein